MDDCISRKAAIEVIDAILPVEPMKNEYAQGITCGAALAKTYVEQLPSAQRKKGKWIHHTDWEYDGECAYECSVCGMGSDVDYDFCMRCGADMRK